MAGKIRACYTTFDPHENTFKESIRRMKLIADEIHVVWGRFKGFDLEYVDPPEWLFEDPDIKLIISDHRFVQYKQRNLALDGLKTGDIVIIIDGDEIFRSKPEDVKEYLSSLKDWDALFIPVVDMETEKVHTKRITIYNFKQGMIHGPGQLLYYNDIMMTSPHFKIIRTPDNIYFYHNTKKKIEYLLEQRKMWAREKQ